MEVIIIQFSPDEKVRWKRTEKRIRMESDHVVKTIKTHTISIWKIGSKGMVKSFLKSTVLAVQSYFARDSELKNDLMNQAKNLMSEVRADGTFINKSIQVKILYQLKGVKKLVPESELVSLQPSVIE